MTNLITKADSLRTNAELTRKEVWKSFQKILKKLFEKLSCGRDNVSK